MIALKSCSNPQKIWQVFASALKKNSGLGFVSDIISGVALGLFVPLHLALGPNHEKVVFCLIFITNLTKIQVF